MCLGGGAPGFGLSPKFYHFFGGFPHYNLLEWRRTNSHCSSKVQYVLLRSCTKGQHFTVAPTSPAPATLPSHLSLDDCLSAGWLSSQPKTVILAIVADSYRQIFVCFASDPIRTTDTIKMTEIVEGSCKSATLAEISEGIQRNHDMSLKQWF